jgi:type IV pilus assembly protein PilA
VPDHPDNNSVIRSRLHALVAVVQRRLQGEEGFTLVELMIVLLTLGILMTIALPSYMSFKDRAGKASATQQLSQAFRAVQSYNADNFPGSRNDPDSNNADTGFTGIDLLALNSKYDASIDTSLASPLVINPIGFTGSPADFCLTATVGRWVAAQHGLNGAVSVGTLFTPGTCIAS